jgi:hypothetical protein
MASCEQGQNFLGFQISVSTHDKLCTITIGDNALNNAYSDNEISSIFKACKFFKRTISCIQEVAKILLVRDYRVEIRHTGSKFLNPIIIMDAEPAGLVLPHSHTPPSTPPRGNNTSSSSIHRSG